MSQNLIDGVGISFWSKVMRRARRRHWPMPGGAERPPDCPPGCRTGPPDFVGVGVHRAGTSWWFELIRRHPRVESRGGTPKEIHFFDRYWWSHFDEASVREYHGYFPRRPGYLVGEWTPRYMHDAWTPPLLKRAAPDAKLLAILRDPVERYLSGVTFDLARGAPRHVIVPSEAFGRGLYGRQLVNLLRHFERGQLLVLQYERCVSDVEGQLRRTLEFLGLDTDLAPTERIGDVSNPTRTAKPRLTELERHILVDAYEDDVRRLVAEFPEIDLGLWPNFSHLHEDVPHPGATQG